MAGCRKVIIAYEHLVSEVAGGAAVSVCVGGRGWVWALSCVEQSSDCPK